MRKSVHRRLRPEPAQIQRAACKDAHAHWGLYSATGERKYVNGDERRRFLAAARRAEPLIRTLCLTLAYTGCRLSEALNLRTGDIELSTGMVCVRSLKKRGQMVVVRQIPSPPKLLAELSRVHSLKRSQTLDVKARLWSWGRTRAWQHVKAVMADANIRALPASPKGLRHGFGVHAILSGVPITLVQRWLGHQDLATTSIYTCVVGPDERKVAGWMWQG